MKNMKKLSILLVGCLVSLSMLAETEGTCAAPKNVKVSNVTYCSAKISWAAGSSNTYAYYLEYEKKVNWASYFTESDDTWLTSMILENLQPNTEYVFRVVAVCNDQSKTRTVEYHFTTESVPTCGKPSNVKVSDIQDISAVISWTPAGSEQAWRIRYRKDGSNTYLYMDAFDTPTQEISGLALGTKYWVSVMANCYYEGTGEFFPSAYSSPEVSFTTSNIPINRVSQQEHNRANRTLDPFTCKTTSSVRLSSSVYGDRTAFYELESNGMLTLLKLENGDKTWDYYPSTVGDHTYVVAATQMTVGAPARYEMPAATAEYPATYWPTVVEGQDVIKYDIFPVTVNYPTVNHNEEKQADLMTNRAEFNLFCTAGTFDNASQRYYCDNTQLWVKIRNSRQQKTIEQGQRSEVMPGNSYTVSLEPGSYVYDVDMLSRAGAVLWRDRFNLKVTPAECREDLVYRKWDDFMFVNNGDYGGKGTFVAYQWYKDGYPVEGATEQWYRTSLYEQESETATGAAPLYVVKIWKEDGTIIYTCASTWSSLKQSKYGQPYHYAPTARKQIINGQLTIERDGQYYNAQGQRVQ